MSTFDENIRVQPGAGIAGGEVAIEYVEISRETARNLSVRFDGEPAHVTALGRARALVLVPATASGESEVSVALNGQALFSDYSRFLVGNRLAGGLHPVANPAFDPSDGSLFVTRSGSRGEHIPISIFRINSDEAVEDFSGDVMNPTAIAFDRSGRMFVTSRFDGAVYRITPVREVVAFAEDLGVPTGLAFNSSGEMYVGDRGGTIFRVNEIGEAEAWAQHEPSVSAYHLAIGRDDALYVTGPTVSSFDEITRFDEGGNPSVFYRGLGRPQGLAFDTGGNLYVAASLRGRRGVVRITPDGSDAELVVAGMNVVGLAFGPTGEMILVTNEAAYSLPLGIHGTLLSSL